MQAGIPPIPEALWKEVQSHLPKLRAYALTLVKSHAARDDLVQDTLVRVLLGHQSYQPGSNMGAWLTTITRNLFLTGMRKKSREVEDAEGIFASMLAAPASQLDYLELQEAFKAMEELPAAQRQALQIVAMQGESYEDAAIEMGVSSGTIKSRVHRARERLEDARNRAATPGLPITSLPARTTDNQGEPSMTYTNGNGHAAPVIPAPQAPDAWIRFKPANLQGRVKLRDVEMAQSIAFGRIADQPDLAKELLRDVTAALITHLEKADIRKPDQPQAMVAYLEQKVYLHLANGKLKPALEDLCENFFHEAVPATLVKGTTAQMITIHAIKDLFEGTTRGGCSNNFWVAMGEMMKERLVFGRKPAIEAAPEAAVQTMAVAEISTALSLPEAPQAPEPVIVVPAQPTLPEPAMPAAPQAIAALPETDEDERAAERFEMIISAAVRENMPLEDIFRLAGCETMEQATQVAGLIDEIRAEMAWEKAKAGRA